MLSLCIINNIYRFNFSKYSIFLINIFQVYRTIININPDLIHTWMYHANLLGGILGKLSGTKKIVWSIRGTYEKN